MKNLTVFMLGTLLLGCGGRSSEGGTPLPASQALEGRSAGMHRHWHGDNHQEMRADGAVLGRSMMRL